MTLPGTTFPDGYEFVVDLSAGWHQLVPQPGEVIEVLLSATDYGTTLKLWAGFLVVEVNYTPLLAIGFRGKFLGVNEATIAKDLSLKFNRKVGWLHLCGSRPCTEPDDYVMHCTQVRWWSLEAFQPSYMTNAVKRQVRKWLLSEKIIQEEAEPELAPLPGALAKSSATKPPPALEETIPPEIPWEYVPDPDGDQGTGDIPGLEWPPPAAVGPEGKEAEKEQPRAELRRRLREVKERLAPGAGQGGTKPPPTLPHGAGVQEIDRNVSTKLAAGSLMNSGSLLRPLGTIPRGGQEEATRERTMKHSRGPAQELMQQAWANLAQKKRSHKRSRKKKKKDPASRLAAAFKSVFQSKSERRKKRPQGGGPPGEDPPSGSGSWTDSEGNHHHRKKKKRKREALLQDGAMVSYSESYSSESEEEASSESTDIEAPMKKRSAKRPGSVLSLLVNHIKQQMSQTSLLDLDPDADSVTQGVKVTTYFGLHIRSNYPSAIKELRELYSLARALDTIRAGDIASASDQLASRFIAIHQSLVDGNWGTAKYMEITPLEEASAATPSLVLATRKHQKICMRVQGQDNGYGGSFGSGRGKGRPSWSSWGRDYDRGESAGKGKGKDSKGKGKNYNQKGKGKGGSGANNQWSQNLEKAEEKTTPK